MTSFVRTWEYFTCWEDIKNFNKGTKMENWSDESTESRDFMLLMNGWNHERFSIVEDLFNAAWHYFVSSEFSTALFSLNNEFNFALNTYSWFWAVSNENEIQCKLRALNENGIEMDFIHSMDFLNARVSSICQSSRRLEPELYENVNASLLFQFLNISSCVLLINVSSMLCTDDSIAQYAVLCANMQRLK